MQQSNHVPNSSRQTGRQAGRASFRLFRVVDFLASLLSLLRAAPRMVPLASVLVDEEITTCSSSMIIQVRMRTQMRLFLRR